MRSSVRPVTPPPIVSGRYTAAFASSAQDVDDAQRLRFDVFNVELGEGLASSRESGRDVDAFDAVCDHLVVRDSRTTEVVGTYRMQSGSHAAECLGYYSEAEFDLTPYEQYRAQVVELGRACVHADHRSLTVVSLLWKQIIRYAERHNGRFLIGCSSLTSQDPALGWAMYHRMAASHLAGPQFRTVPRPTFALPSAEPLVDCPPAPRLLRAYLTVGARICGPPAIDREFKTIDFLTLLEISMGSAQAVKHFVGRLSE